MVQCDALTLFRYVCEKPGMYVQAHSFVAVVAFIEGYDLALQGGALVGFREWLLTGSDEWTNLSWSMLIRHQRDPATDLSRPPVGDEDEALLGDLSKALESFSRDLTTGGLHVIFHRYNTWLLSRSEPTTAELRTRLRGDLDTG